VFLCCFSGSAVSEEEIKIAEEKFEESRKLAWIAMKNVLENDVSCKRYATFSSYKDISGSQSSPLCKKS
jgi:hypothetical protein